MKPLTDKQAEVLSFLRSFHKQHGYMPTMAEIADHFKWRSATAAVGHLDALIIKGRITKDARAHRNIVIL